MKKPELLAPAGDLNRAKIAIQYGADAVYLGGQSYSLRARASNFTMADIQEACQYAKEHGARIHVTVNVIPHEEDFEGLKEYLQQLEAFGVTAIIAASPAILSLAKQCAPKLERHCSTQMSITNVEAAKFLYESLDLERVVLARECTMEQVSQITKTCPIETEAFIHGGMCVNYSGRCTLSNRMTLRDANRGGCAQSCRWEYRLFDDGKEISQDMNFTMGSKDLLAGNHLIELMKAGVSSLKIEGRMKTEYYVATIVSAYRNFIDEIAACQGNVSPERIAYHMDQIARAENRESCDGFYPGEAGKETIIYHEYSNNVVSHDFLGTIQSYDPNTQTAIIQTRNAFDVGDRIEILAPRQPILGFQLEWIQNLEGEYMERSKSPMVCVKIPMPYPIAKQAIIRRARS